MSYDQQGVEDASRALLEAVGEDINREGLRNTPRGWVVRGANFSAASKKILVNT